MACGFFRHCAAFGADCNCLHCTGWASHRPAGRPGAWVSLRCRPPSRPVISGAGT